MVSSIRSVLRDIAVRFVGALVVTTLVAAGVMVFGNQWVDDFVKDIPRLPKEDSDELTPTDSGSPKTYLIIGSDTRGFVETGDRAGAEAFCEPGEVCDTGGRSDSMLLVHIETNPVSAYVVSIPRDLLADVNGREQKINAAYTEGAGGLVRALSENFGIIVNHVAIVDFEQFQKINEVVGGVHIPFPYPARDRKIKVDFEAGCVNLDSGKALSFVRSRSMEELIDGEWRYTHSQPDIGRISRQQLYFRNLSQKAATEASDVREFIALAEEVNKFITVDVGFTRSDFLKLVNAMSQLDLGSNDSLVMETFPWVPAGDGANLKPDINYWPGVVDRLNGGKGSELEADEITLRVLNASGRDGAAATVAEFYEAFGITPASPPTGNAEQLQDATEVRYATGALEAAQPLKPFLGENVEMIQDASLTDVDVEIVLGKSFPGLVDFEAALAASSAAAVTSSVASSSVPQSSFSTTTTTTTSVGRGADPRAKDCKP